MIGTFGNAFVPYTTVPSPAPRRHARAAARIVSSQYTTSGVPYSSASSTVEQPPTHRTPSRISAVSGNSGSRSLE